jgi:hypothetical protein
MVMHNNCVPFRVKRHVATAFISDFAAGHRYAHYECGNSVVQGDQVLGMFIQELPYDQRKAAKLQEELLQRQVERERKERDLLGDDQDGD